jgi:hypothetical protein
MGTSIRRRASMLSRMGRPATAVCLNSNPNAKPPIPDFDKSAINVGEDEPADISLWDIASKPAEDTGNMRFASTRSYLNFIVAVRQACRKRRPAPTTLRRAGAGRN